MDWKVLIGTVAPWIATALTGPLGGMAVGAAADALGLSEKTEGALRSALAGVTPEQMMALKLADENFSIRMQELGFQNTQALEKIAAEDRNSAREREIKTGDSATPRVIACVVIVGFFAILLVMILRGLPAGASNEAALILLGALGSSFAGVIAYYFGSTASSSRKTELIAKSGPVGQ